MDQVERQARELLGKLIKYRSVSSGKTYVFRDRGELDAKTDREKIPKLVARSNYKGDQFQVYGIADGEKYPLESGHSFRWSGSTGSSGTNTALLEAKMTSVSCVLCHRSAHISYEWPIYFENYEVKTSEGYISMPEIGVCGECYRKAILDEVPSNLVEKVRSELTEIFLEEVGDKIESKMDGRKQYLKEQGKDWTEEMDRSWEIKAWNGDEPVMTKEEYLAMKLKKS